MDEAAEAPAPRFYVRVVETPPGAPWDQSQAARLDASLGAPLGGDALTWAVERLAPWRPRTPGRFGVAYVRRGDAPAGPSTLVVEGAQVRFRFSTSEDRNQHLRTMATTGVLAAASILGVVLGVQKALFVRAEREATLAQLEVNARGWDQVARLQSQAASDATALRTAGAQGEAFGDLAADLFWLGRAKAPSVTIQRVHWSRSGLEVTTAGPGRPVIGSERTVDAVGGSDAARIWRIGLAQAAPAERRAGISRPSVAVSAQERARTLGGHS